MLRVLVADDSPTNRAILVAVLRSDPDIQVVGEARDGAEAVALTRKLRPDVVTMDVLMPRVDGFEATRQIMIEMPTPIVVVTGHTEGDGALMAMHALRAGALTIVPKSPTPTSADWCRHLVSTVKSMAEVKLVRRWGAKPSSPKINAVSRPTRVVAIGASTGGPAALYRILSDLPEDFAAPILVVQHISSGFVGELAAWLNTASLLRVEVATPGARLAPRTMYLAADDGHLGLADRSTIAISSADPVDGFRPSATHLFESVSRVFGASSLGIILTGMGSDGAAGLLTLRRSGGRVLAQDEESSVVYGMPRAAIELGAADVGVSLSVLAARMCSIVNEDRDRGKDE